jgi:hypothetical protein
VAPNPDRRGKGEQIVTQIVVDEEHYSHAKLVSVGSVYLKPRHGEFVFRREFSFANCGDVYVVSTQEKLGFSFFANDRIGIPRQYS